MTDIDLDRERIACVFGLGGGELHVPHPEFRDEWDGPKGIAHWYEGVPDYATDLADLDDARTAILDCMFGVPEPPPGWKVVASFASSGEAECWCGEGGGDDDREECPLCEGDGIIYIGDGWREVVMVRELEWSHLPRLSAGPVPDAQNREFGNRCQSSSGQHPAFGQASGLHQSPSHARRTRRPRRPRAFRDLFPAGGGSGARSPG